MQEPLKPVVLVAPLDWGWGHTIRSVSIIRHFLAEGWTVRMAGSREQVDLAKFFFPFLEFFEFSGRPMTYGRTGLTTALGVLLRMPKLFRNMRREHDWLLRHCRENRTDLIVSDNRYGFHHPEIPSVVVTHQLQIRTAFGNWIRRPHFRLLEKFRECWAPDQRGNTAIAGLLSNPPAMPRLPVHYIGWLTALPAPGPETATEISDRTLILLSGPEPQRSILEKRLLAECASLPGTVVFVRGVLKGKRSLGIPAHVRLMDLLTGPELAREIAQARVVVARTGYSTLMDLVLMGKRGVLIPTPGQPEQQYLAREMMKKSWFVCRDQRAPDLVNSVQEASGRPIHFPTGSGNRELQERIRTWTRFVQKQT